MIFFCLMLFFFFVGTIFAAVLRALEGDGTDRVLPGHRGTGGRRWWPCSRYTGTWPAVGQFFVTYQAIGTALWLLVPTALAGIGGYFILRRATPRS